MRRSIGRKHTHTAPQDNPPSIRNANVSLDLPSVQFAFVSVDRYHRGEAGILYVFPR